MGLIDLVSLPGQQIAYLFPEVTGPSSAQNPTLGLGIAGGLRDVFVFQFWPNQVSDRYEVNYATKSIPGGSHPLYQWVGGNGRTISFDATFVSEIDEASYTQTGLTFNEQIQAQTVTAGQPGNGLGAALGAALLPSARYTVNVKAAIAALQKYLYGKYNDIEGKKGITEPPKKLVLVLPNTALGRSDGNDGILCILLRADVTMESWYPTGNLRVATVALEFAEIVQHTDAQGSNIKFIGADAYDNLSRAYTIQGTSFNKVSF
jgi:hypothetical protein